MRKNMQRLSSHRQIGYTRAFRALLVLWMLLICSCDGRSAMSLPLAGIFGLGGNNKEDATNSRRPPPQAGQGPPPRDGRQPPPQSRGHGPPLQGNRPPPPQHGRGPPPQGGRGTPPTRDERVTPPQGQPQRRPPFMPPQGMPPPQQTQRRQHPPPIRNQQGRQFLARPEQPPPPPPVLENSEKVSSHAEDSIALDADAVEEAEIVASASEDGLLDEEALNETISESNVEIREQEEPDRLAGIQETPLSPDLETQLTVEQQMPPLHDSPRGWMDQPPPSNYNGWAAPPPDFQQGGWLHQPVDPSYNVPLGMQGPPMMIQEELDMSLAREHDLLLQVNNLTEMATNYRQREEIHMRQLDVLTERVMEVESQAAEDRNLLLEYEANCTALGMTIATLQDELEEWQKRCADLKDLREQDEERVSEMKQTLKEKSSEAEELAIAIENLRLVERVKGASNSRRNQGKRGFFSWVLGFFLSNDSDYEEVTREDAYEMGKSTLLRALQTERSSVHELESAVASLQQNNSAISEMVDSRDMIIDELNNRIAVFEEDKVVLKAALRQLQKEMQEEAPKTQKLLEGLAASTEEVKRLNAEINSIIKTHQSELNSLQKTIWIKQKAINETESNLTAIGTYVDKLEERLTSFAITRRDMEEREKKCKAIEESAAKADEEVVAMKAKVEEFTKEQEDLKKLLEELALERTNLQKENRKLLTEREFRIGEEQQLQASTTAMEVEVQRLTEKLNDAITEADALKISLEAAQASNSELQEEMRRIEELEAELETSRQEKFELTNDHQKSREQLEAMLNKTRQEVERLKFESTKPPPKEEESISKADVTISPNLVTPPESHKREERKVPFRNLRKRMSKLTGLHGVVTPSTKMEQVRFARQQKRRPPRTSTTPGQITTKRGKPFAGLPNKKEELRENDERSSGSPQVQSAFDQAAKENKQLDEPTSSIQTNEEHEESPEASTNDGEQRYQPPERDGIVRSSSTMERMEYQQQAQQQRNTGPFSRSAQWPKHDATISSAPKERSAFDQLSNERELPDKGTSSITRPDDPTVHPLVNESERDPPPPPPPGASW